MNNVAFVIHTPQNQLNDAQHELAIAAERLLINLPDLVKQSQIQPSEDPQPQVPSLE
jgi:hypothetical protein